MSTLLAALLGGVVLVQPSADAMQTLLNAAVTLRTFDHFATSAPELAVGRGK
jgi:hypothetical protein